MNEKSIRKTIHYAAHLTSSKNYWSWSRIELVIVAYTAGEKSEVVALVIQPNYYSKDLLFEARQGAIDGKAAIVTARNWAKNPLRDLPLSRIKDEKQLSELQESLSRLNKSTVIYGSARRVPSWKRCQQLAKTGELVISLALGQALVSAVEDDRPISPELENTLSFYIENIPLVAGHWGSFKRLFKILETRSDAPSLFGRLLARVDAGIIYSPRKNVKKEELSFLSSFLTGPIASKETLQYLARRGRRFLRRLSKEDPKSYVACVTSLIVATDRSGVYREITRRWILADVIYARCARDTSHGKGPLHLPDETDRYRRRWDRTARLWNQRLSLICSIWKSTNSNIDIQCWAFNVLKSQRVEIPRLFNDALKLALISPYSSVRNIACKQIAENPSRFPRLDTSSASAFLWFSSNKQFSSVFRVLENKNLPGPVQNAIFDYVNNEGLQSISRGESPTSVTPRAQKLLGYTLRHLRDRLRDTDTLNLALYIGESDGFRPAKLWSSTFDALSLSILVELRLQLPELSSSAKNTIDNACRKATAHDDKDVRLAAALIHSPSRQLQELAWSVLISTDVEQDTIADVWLSLVEHATKSDGAVRLRQCIYEQERIKTLLAHDSASSLLGEVALALAQRERSASKKALNFLADTRDANVIAQTLSQIVEQYPHWSWARDNKLLRALIVKVPETREIIWSGLANDQFVLLMQHLREIRGIFRTFLDVIDPTQLSKIVPRQATVLVELLQNEPSRLIKERDLSIAATTCPAPEVSSTAIAILEARAKIGDIYLPLIESQFPAAVASAERYLQTVTDKAKLTNAIIAVCDSGVSMARVHGLSMLAQRSDEYDEVKVYSALAEHKSPEICSEVGGYLAKGGHVRRKMLDRYEDRVLRTRRQGRKAKELVKIRLQSQGIGDVRSITVSSANLDSRIQSLLGLARGSSLRDREWALQQLIHLKNEGVEIPNFNVSLTS